MVIPPFFLLASLFVGAQLGDVDLSLILKPDTTKELFGVLAATVVLVLPLGFLISSISVVLLSGIAKACQKVTYEAVLSEAVLECIWDNCGRTDQKQTDLTLYATATFDHEILSDGIHQWLRRRWNHFNVAAHSVVALLLAHLVAYWISISQCCQWWTLTGAVCLVFVVTGSMAWRQTMCMVEFQSQRTADAKPDDSAA